MNQALEGAPAGCFMQKAIALSSLSTSIWAPRLRLAAATALAILWAHSANALSLRVDFADSMRSSALVAWVEVEASETIVSANGQSCGARYTARVIRSLKGAVNGQRIQFGFYGGHARGTQYFVFLDPTSTVLQHTTGKAPPPMVSPVPYLPECAAVLPGFLETAEGMGTIPLVIGKSAPSRPTVSLRSSSYAIPARLAAAHHHTGQVIDGELWGSVEIEADAFFQYLGSLPSGQ